MHSRAPNVSLNGVQSRSASAGVLINATAQDIPQSAAPFSMVSGTNGVISAANDLTRGNDGCGVPGDVIRAAISAPLYGIAAPLWHRLTIARGITHFFPWQHHCLAQIFLPEHRAENILYCMPTSGGKTLVAEVLICHAVTVLRKDALFIVPCSIPLPSSHTHLCCSASSPPPS